MEIGSDKVNLRKAMSQGGGDLEGFNIGFGVRDVSLFGLQYVCNPSISKTTYM